MAWSCLVNCPHLSAFKFFTCIPCSQLPLTPSSVREILIESSSVLLIFACMVGTIPISFFFLSVYITTPMAENHLYVNNQNHLILKRPKVWFRLLLLQRFLWSTCAVEARWRDFCSKWTQSFYKAINFWWKVCYPLGWAWKDRTSLTGSY